MSALASSLQVRPLGKADIEPVVRLVRAQEFAHEHPPEVLRRLFEHPWAPDEPDAGFVLTAGEKIVGVIVGVYARRIIDEQPYGFCNISTWYVEPDYRRQSLLLLRSLMAREEYTLTNFSSSPDVGRILEALHFQSLGRNRLFWRARLTSRLRFTRRDEVLVSPQIIEEILDDEDRQIFHDHRPYSCGHYVLRAGDQYCYLVTKRRPLKGGTFMPGWFPARLRRRPYFVSDLLFISDPVLALRQWDSLLHQVTLLESTIGIIVEEFLLGPAVPPGARKLPHNCYAYRLRTDPRHVNTLYSELVLLPL